MNTLTLQYQRNMADENGVVYALYPIPAVDSNGNCCTYRSFKINPIPFDGYITVKLGNDYMFNIQVCGGISKILRNNDYASFGTGAYVMIPLDNNSIQNTVITADVKFTKDKQCAATKNWNINAYSKGYRVMDSNGKAIWGPKSPPHCVAMSWNINNMDNIDYKRTIQCNCPFPTEPPPYPKPSSLNDYYSSSHVGVL